MELDLSDVLRSATPSSTASRWCASARPGSGLQLERRASRRTSGPVHADELRFKQVLLNLLSNAVKFTPDGGPVDRSARPRGRRRRGPVQDTGVGHRGRPTRSGSSTPSSRAGARAGRSEGTGLGLTLCKRIVELHGGGCGWTARSARGSTFGFRLPARPAAAHRRRPHGRRIGSVVLLVEDDRGSVDLLTRLPGGQRLPGRSRPRTAPTGWPRSRQQRPAAVVLDIRLPGMDGWDVLSAAPRPTRTTAAHAGRRRVGARRARPRHGAGRVGVPGEAGQPGTTSSPRLRSAVRRRDPATRSSWSRTTSATSSWCATSWSTPASTSSRPRTGEEGVALAREQPPDLILMDLQLPGIDGTRRCASSATARHAAVPVVAVTAFAMAEDRERALTGRLRRLPREADQRPRPARPGARLPQSRGAMPR